MTVLCSTQPRHIGEVIVNILRHQVGRGYKFSINYQSQNERTCLQQNIGVNILKVIL
jgi:hypothetical protein